MGCALQQNLVLAGAAPYLLYCNNGRFGFNNNFNYLCQEDIN